MCPSSLSPGRPWTVCAPDLCNTSQPDGWHGRRDTFLHVLRDGRKRWCKPQFLRNTVFLLITERWNYTRFVLMDTRFPHLASWTPCSSRLPSHLFSSSFPQPTLPPPRLPGNMVHPRAPRPCLLSLLEASIQALGCKHHQGLPWWLRRWRLCLRGRRPTSGPICISDSTDRGPWLATAHEVQRGGILSNYCFRFIFFLYMSKTLRFLFHCR